jgi:hypothetical protein
MALKDASVGTSRGNHQSEQLILLACNFPKPQCVGDAEYRLQTGPWLADS